MTTDRASPRYATFATELTQDEVRALTARLEQSTGGRIALDVEVDPSLLGVSSCVSAIA